MNSNSQNIEFILSSLNISDDKSNNNAVKENTNNSNDNSDNDSKHTDSNTDYTNCNKFDKELAYKPELINKICYLNHYSCETHEYIGEYFRCEDCNEWGCKDHISNDCWDERFKDKVFLCDICRRFEIY